MEIVGDYRFRKAQKMLGRSQGAKWVTRHEKGTQTEM